MAEVEYSPSTASKEAATPLSYNSSNGNPTPESSTFADEAQNQNPLPAKKKRNQPGMPDPEAEVVALSPKSLMATNRFVCEICGKGFQREQNLQLHRRGHNLPWKLRQRGPEEGVRKRVYVCPERSCVHHDPRRALGDLTGIKKHFCRKHGEKKWKCEKCSKKYAVQSDWKAHLKTCGSRQYQCDCGTVFSRRDSFVTHRAFCDALTQESAKVQRLSGGSLSPVESVKGSPPANAGVVVSPVLSTSQSLEMKESTTSSTTWLPSSATEFNGNENGNIAFETTMFAPLSRISQSIPQPQASFPSLGTAHPTDIATPAISATALLQKAAQMGASASGPSLLCGFSLAKPEDGGSSVHDGLGLGLPSGGNFGMSSPMVGHASGPFGSKPMMLDFLSLGIGPGSSSAGSELPSYLSSIGGPLDMAAALRQLQDSWDGEADERKPEEAVL